MNYTGYTLATQLEKLFNDAIGKYSKTIWDLTSLYEQNTNTLTITRNLKQGEIYEWHGNYTQIIH